MGAGRDVGGLVTRTAPNRPVAELRGLEEVNHQGMIVSGSERVSDNEGEDQAALKKGTGLTGRSA